MPARFSLISPSIATSLRLHLLTETRSLNASAVETVTQHSHFNAPILTSFSRFIYLLRRAYLSQSAAELSSIYEESKLLTSFFTFDLFPHFHPRVLYHVLSRNPHFVDRSRSSLP